MEEAMSLEEVYKFLVSPIEFLCSSFSTSYYSRPSGGYWMLNSMRQASMANFDGDITARQEVTWGVYS